MNAGIPEITTKEARKEGMNEVSSESSVGQEPEAKRLAGHEVLAIYRTSKWPGLRLEHKISNHGLTLRTRQSVHMYGNSRADQGCTITTSVTQRTCAPVGGGEELLRQPQVGSVVNIRRADHWMCRYSFFLVAH